MPDAPILPDEDSFSSPSVPTMRGGDPASLGRIDHYDVLRKLGGGGFGVVYLARDTASGVEVAIKTLHTLLKRNAEEMDLLREKFALVSRLSHPNIATALVLHPCRDINLFDETARAELKLSPGDSVMVMRYAPGVTLSKWRRQFPDGIVPLDLALEVGRQVAAALDYAHSERIVHRDIKPSNVVVETVAAEPRPLDHGQGAARSPSAPTLRVRILDFGLAAEIRSSMSRVSTEAGDTSGTRPYMAPEQWLGRKQDGRTDQYALACVLYELLSGAPPFAGVFETGDPAVMMAAVKSEAPAAIDTLPRAADAALLRALAKDPAARFPNCLAFVDAVGRAIRARRGGSSGTPRPRRFRYELAAAALLAVGTLGAILLSPPGGGNDHAKFAAVESHAENPAVESHAENAEVESHAENAAVESHAENAESIGASRTGEPLEPHAESAESGGGTRSPSEMPKSNDDGAESTEPHGNSDASENDSGSRPLRNQTLELAIKADEACIKARLAKTRFDRFSSLAVENRIAVAAYLVQDQSLFPLLSLKDDLELRLAAQTRAGLGSNHPEVQQSRSLLENVDRQINGKLAAIRAGLQQTWEQDQQEADFYADLLAKKCADGTAALSGAAKERYETDLAEARAVKADKASIKARLAKSRFDRFSSLVAENGIAAAAAFVQDQSLSPLLSTKNDLELQLDARSKAGLGANHPEMQQSRSLLENVDRQINDRLAAICVSLLNDWKQDQREADYYADLHAGKSADEAATGSDAEKAAEEVEVARIYASAERWTEAIEAARKALDRDPGNDAAAKLKVQAETALRKIADAKAEVERKAKEDAGRTISTERNRTKTAPSAQTSVGARPLRPDDTVEVFLHIPADDKSSSISDVVDSFGVITLPLVGDIKVGSLTTSEAEKAIVAAYVDGGYYQQIDVTVVCQSMMQERLYYVEGAVKKNGSFQWTDNLTLRSAIINAGGVDDFANRVIELTRGGVTTKYNLHQIERGTVEDPPIQPGDILKAQKRWL